nr:hypothetical protein [Bradyrhizobium zhanjiangense]
MALDDQLTSINTVIDTMPRDAMFGLSGKKRPRRRMSSGISRQRTVVVIESASTRFPKHIRWQYERIGNGKYPLDWLGVEQRR